MALSSCPITGALLPGVRLFSSHQFRGKWPFMDTQGRARPPLRGSERQRTTRKMSFGTSARNPAAWLGFAGSSTLLLASIARTSVPLSGPTNTLRSRIAEGITAVDLTLISILGVILLSGAWWLLRPRCDAVRPDLRLIAAVWVLPLMLSPPLLSGDAIVYCDLGWTIEQGLSPYESGLSAAGGPCAALVDPFWQGTTSPYPPLGLWVMWLSSKVAGFDPYYSTVVLRVITVMAWAGAAAVVPELARRLGVRPSSALWFGMLNPLVIVHVVGGVHGDALMVVAVILALRFATSPHFALSVFGAAAMGGLGAAIKPQAAIAWWAVALIPVGGLPQGGLAEWGRAAFRLALTGVSAVAAFVVITLSTRLGFGWVDSLSLSSQSASVAPARILSLLLAPSGNDHWSTIAGLSQALGALVALTCLLAFPRDPVKGLGWGSLALFGLGAVLHPWYLVFPIAVLGLSRIGPAQAWAVGLLMIWVGTAMVLYETLATDPFNTGLHIVVVAALVGVLLTLSFSVVFRVRPAEMPLFAAGTRSRRT